MVHQHIVDHLNNHLKKDGISYKWSHNILHKQGLNLLKYLPDWKFGRSKIYPYRSLYSPVLKVNQINYDNESLKMFNGVNSFIRELNEKNESISRIDYSIIYLNSKDEDFTKTKFINLLVKDVFLTENYYNETIYLNKFTRSTDNAKYRPIRCEYFVLQISSPWRSI